MLISTNHFAMSVEVALQVSQSHCNQVLTFEIMCVDSGPVPKHIRDLLVERSMCFTYQE